MIPTQPDFIAIYTDGACSGNPGPGGWGSIIVDAQGQVIELGGEEKPTTNNRMEVRAALEALLEIEGRSGPVYVYTDSTYLIRGITQWIWGWRKNGWKTASGEVVQNRELFEALSRVVAARKGDSKIEWVYVRGHTGNPGNERCDRIAVAYSQGQKPKLFRGPVKDYSVDILDFPDSEGLPEMRPKAEKVAAYSYLSTVDGVTYRHSDWSSCERRVKGRSGARFKKALNAANELEILQGWGVSPSNVKDDGN